MFTSFRLIPTAIRWVVFVTALLPFALDFFYNSRNVETAWFLHSGAVFLISYISGLRAGLLAASLSVVTQLIWKIAAGMISGSSHFSDPWLFGFNVVFLFLFAVFIGLLTDKLNDKHKELTDIFNSLDATIWSHDLKEDTIIISKGVEFIYGYTGKDFARDPSLWSRVVHPDDTDIADKMNENALSGLPTNTEFRIIRPDGQIRWIQDKATPIFDKDHKLVRINGVVIDITDRKIAEEQIMRLANYDYLTGLPNRKFISDRLRSVIGQQHEGVAVLFLDLDGFKPINDTMGHDAGDVLLQEVSRRMQTQLRPSDSLGRIGGDEFLAVIEGLNKLSVASFAQQMIDAVSLPYRVAGQDAHISLSIGISLYPEDGGTCEELMKCADLAMYAAKSAGKRTYRFFSGPVG